MLLLLSFLLSGGFCFISCLFPQNACCVLMIELPLLCEEVGKVVLDGKVVATIVYFSVPVIFFPPSWVHCVFTICT